MTKNSKSALKYLTLIALAFGGIAIAKTAMATARRKKAEKEENKAIDDSIDADVGKVVEVAEVAEEVSAFFGMRGWGSKPKSTPSGDCPNMGCNAGCSVACCCNAVTGLPTVSWAQYGKETHEKLVKGEKIKPTAAHRKIAKDMAKAKSSQRFSGARGKLGSSKKIVRGVGDSTPETEDCPNMGCMGCDNEACCCIIRAGVKIPTVTWEKYGKMIHHQLVTGKTIKPTSRHKAIAKEQKYSAISYSQTNSRGMRSNKSNLTSIANNGGDSIGDSKNVMGGASNNSSKNNSSRHRTSKRTKLYNSAKSLY